MWGPSDVKLRISIKIRDKSIWHSASPSLLSGGGRYRGWNEQSEGRVYCGDKEAGADGAALG